MELVGNKVAFKGSNKLYLSRCSGCWKGGSYPDAAVFVYSATPVATALWTPELLPNGKYAFKGDNGKYLSRCNHCSSNKTSASFVFAHEPNAANPWSQWNVVYARIPAPGVVTLKADNGLTSCGSSSELEKKLRSKVRMGYGFRDAPTAGP